METKAHHVLIGAFVTLAVAAAMAFALWLSHSYGDQSIKTYRVVFNETVRGLSQGSAVEYSGIAIGEVSSLGLDPGDPRRVIASIRISGNIPVREDTKAVLALTGLTGTSVIQLSGGTPDSPVLLGKDGQDPVIIASPSPFARFLNSGENTVANINDLLRSARQVFSPENVDNISRILANVEKASGMLAEQSGHLSQMMAAVGEAGKRADQALGQITKLVGSAEQLLKERGSDILNSANNAVASLAQISGEVEKLMANNYGALSSGMQGMGELGPALRELRTTLSSLRALAQRLDEDPAGYLLGRDTIREYQP